MAKATVQGASMTPEEYEHAEYVSPRVRRPQVQTSTMRKKKVKENPNVGTPSTVEGGAESVGGNSTQDTNPPVENDNETTNSDRSTVPVTENPSSQEEEEPNIVDSTDGTAQTTNRSGRKAPAKKATPASKRASVRSTDDMDLSF